MCNEASDNCYSPSGTACNDGLYCTASDSCNGVGSCVGSGNPCTYGNFVEISLIIVVEDPNVTTNVMKPMIIVLLLLELDVQLIHMNVLPVFITSIFE